VDVQDFHAAAGAFAGPMLARVEDADVHVIEVFRVCLRAVSRFSAPPSNAHLAASEVNLVFQLAHGDEESHGIIRSAPPITSSKTTINIKLKWRHPPEQLRIVDLWHVIR
jgi:hypothetical protein